MDGAAGVAAVGRTAAPGRTGWTSVGVLGVGAFAIGTGSFVVAGVLGDLADDLGVTPGAAGLTVTVFALALAVGSPLLSALVGARPGRVLKGSLALFGALNVLAAVAPTLAVLLGARVASALAASVYIPAALATAVAAVPASHRGRALAVILGGSSMAMVLGAPLGVLLAAALSWRAAFGLVAVLAAVAVLGLLLAGGASGAEVRSAGEPRSPLSVVRMRLAPLRSPTVAGALAVTALAMTGSNAVYTYVDPLLGAAVGPAGLGLLIGVFGVGGVVGTWWGGVAADRWGSRPVVLMAAGLLTAGFVLSPVLTSTPPGAGAFVAVWGIAAFGYVPAQQHRLIGLADGPAPVVLALNSSAIHLGFAAGALFGGRVVDAAGAEHLWVLAAACCGAALGLHGILTRDSRS